MNCGFLLFCFLGLSLFTTALADRIAYHESHDGDFSESVTNFVHWYDKEHPNLSIVESGATSALSIRSRSGKQFSVPLQLHP
jgi:hypothetical protein